MDEIQFQLLQYLNKFKINEFETRMNPNRNPIGALIEPINLNKTKTICKLQQNIEYIHF